MRRLIEQHYKQFDKLSESQKNIFREYERGGIDYGGSAGAMAYSGVASSLHRLCINSFSKDYLTSHTYRPLSDELFDESYRTLADVCINCYISEPEDSIEFVKRCREAIEMEHKEWDRLMKQRASISRRLSGERKSCGIPAHT